VSTVVVFIIGGFTYEEAAAVHQLNASLGLQVESLSLSSLALQYCVSGSGLVPDWIRIQKGIRANRK
jgi:hypothetical protein